MQAQTRRVSLKKLKKVPAEMVKPLPIDEEPYPQPRNPDLPRMFWLWAMCGQRGSGKTQLAIRALLNYELCGFSDADGHDVPMRIVLFSPTYAANPAYKRLKTIDKGDVHEIYTDAALLKVMKETEEDRQATRDYKKACVMWKRFQGLIRRDKDPLLLMPQDDLKFLSAKTCGFQDEPQVPPHPHGRVTFLILDDCLSSSAFSLNRQNRFSGHCCNSRHGWTNILVLSQRLKQLPPVVRANLTVLSHWRLMSTKILCEEVWPSVSQLLTEDDFLTLFHTATSANTFDCLTIDTTAEPGKTVKRNLNEIMTLQ